MAPFIPTHLHTLGRTIGSIYIFYWIKVICILTVNLGGLVGTVGRIGETDKSPGCEGGGGSVDTALAPPDPDDSGFGDGFGGAPQDCVGTGGCVGGSVGLIGHGGHWGGVGFVGGFVGAAYVGAGVGFVGAGVGFVVAFVVAGLGKP